MKKVVKYLAMLCMAAFVGIVSRPVTASAGYITTQPLSMYEYSATEGYITFYAETSWTAQVAGFSNMISFTSPSYGSSGYYRLDFKLSENSQNYDREAYILIMSTSGYGQVLADAHIQQEGKNKQQSTSQYFKNLTSLKENERTTFNWNDTSIYLEFESNCDISVTYNGSKISMSNVKQSNGSNKYYGVVSLGYNESKDDKFGTLKVNVNGDKVVGGKERTFYVLQKRTPVVLTIPQIVGERYDSLSEKRQDITYKITTNDDFYVWYTYYDLNGTLHKTDKKRVTVNIPSYSMAKGATINYTDGIKYTPKKILGKTVSACLYLTVHMQGVHGGKEVATYIEKSHYGN